MLRRIAGATIVGVGLLVYVQASIDLAKTNTPEGGPDVSDAQT